MRNRKIEKTGFIYEVIESIEYNPTSIFLKEFPQIIKKHLPLPHIIFYYKDIRGDRYIPFSDELNTGDLIVLKDTSKIIAAFTKNQEALFLSDKQQIYIDLFNKDTDNLLSKNNINLIIPTHFKKNFYGLILAYLERKDKKLSSEIVDTLRMVTNIFIPWVETERLELKNDRNYYKLFKFDRLVLLGEMVASFAHEFRTPLHTIQLEMKELADQLKPDSIQSASFERLNRQISRLRKLINSLLSFSKAQDMYRENFKLKIYIDTLLDEIPKKKIPPGVKIETKIEEDIQVFSDKNRLRQVITNILFNAFDAVSKGGEIEIEAYIESQSGEKDEKCIVSIKDNGPGIPQEIKERIFEPFFTTRETGTGLGLYIAYGIINSLKGSLDVESSGKGTAFFIRLPKGENNGKEIKNLNN